MQRAHDTKSLESEKDISHDSNPLDALEALCGATSPKEAFSRLSRWAEDAATLQTSADFVEQQLFSGGFELLRLMLQHHLTLRTEAELPLALILNNEDGTQTRLAHRREHKRQYESIFGTIEINRIGFGVCGVKSIHPIDKELNLPKCRYSHLLQKRAATLSGRGPFSEAVEDLKQTTAANFPKRQIQESVVENAQDFEAFYQERRESIPPPEKTGPILVAGLDCKGVPKRRSSEQKQEQRGKRLTKGQKKSKKKMATVASVHTTQPFVRTPEQVISRLMDKEPSKLEQKRPKAEHRRLWASLHKSKNELFGEVSQELEQRDPERKKVVVCVMDGEKALKIRAVEYLKTAFPGLIMILDIIHVAVYLWKAVYAFFEEGIREAHDWVRMRLLSILEGKVSRVVAGMRSAATKRKLSDKKRKPVDAACNYFLNNKERMHYHKYLSAGLPIGSGCVEGACGHLVKDRMERTGASWDVDGNVAEAVLKMRAIDKSGDFEEYWNFHLSQEKNYNYGRAWQPI